METHNYFPIKDIKSSGWTTHPVEGQTLTANINKEPTTQPTTPEIEKLIECAALEKTAEIEIIPTLPAGSRIIEATVWVYCSAAELNSLKLVLKGQSLFVPTGAAAWRSIKLTMKEAEELKANNYLKMQSEKAVVNKVYAAYVVLKYLNPGEPLLIGSTEGAATAKVIAKNRPTFIQFQAEKTGTVESLILETTSTASTATAVQAAVWTDNAGIPETMLGSEGELVGSFSTIDKFNIPGLSAKIVQGQKYWLAFSAVGGSLKIKWTKELGTPTRQSKTAEVSKISETTTAGWNADTANGPMFLEGLGSVFTLVGTLKFASNAEKKTKHALAAALSFVSKIGGVGPIVQKVFGSLSFAGNIPTKIKAKQAATLSFSGVLSFFKEYLHKVEAALSFSGALPRKIRSELPSVLSFVGELPRNIKKGLAGNLSFSGVLPRIISHALQAELKFLGVLQRAGAHVIAAVLNFAGAIKPKTRHQFEAALSFAGVLRKTRQTFAAVLKFVGSLLTKITSLFQAYPPTAAKVQERHTSVDISAKEDPTSAKLQ